MRQLAFCAAVLFGCAAYASPSLNLPAALADTKAALASPAGSADIVVLGDSLSFRTGSYLPVFRSLLQAQYGNGGAGYQGFSLQTDGGFNSGWSNGLINEDTSPHRSLDGLWASSSASPYPPTFTSARLDAWSATAELHYVAQPGGGSFRMDLPNGTSVTIDTEAASSQLRTYTHTFSTSDHRVWYQPLGNGPVTILGQENGAGPGVRVDRAANGGWGVGNFLQRDWTFDAQLSEISPDLVMIALGQNDQGYSRAAYKDAVAALVDRVLASAPDSEIVLIGNYDSGSSNILGPVLGMQDLASERGLGFINLYETAGSYQTFLNNGWLDDGIHFSTSGGEHVGQLLYDAFMSDGASLVPEPSAACALLTTTLLLLRRRMGARSR